MTQCVWGSSCQYDKSTSITCMNLTPRTPLPALCLLFLTFIISSSSQNLNFTLKFSLNWGRQHISCNFLISYWIYQRENCCWTELSLIYLLSVSSIHHFVLCFLSIFLSLPFQKAEKKGNLFNVATFEKGANRYSEPPHSFRKLWGPEWG